MGRAMTRDTGGQHSGKRVCDAGLKESRKAAELIFDSRCCQWGRFSHISDIGCSSPDLSALRV
jgi:hypothetical protein